jgi:hypothetical protein
MTDLTSPGQLAAIIEELERDIVDLARLIDGRPVGGPRRHGPVSAATDVMEPPD